MAKAPAGKKRSAGSERLVLSLPARGLGRAHESQLGNVVLPPPLVTARSCAAWRWEGEKGRKKKRGHSWQASLHRGYPTTLLLLEPVFIRLCPQRTVIICSTNLIVKYYESIIPSRVHGKLIIPQVLIEDLLCARRLTKRRRHDRERLTYEARSQLWLSKTPFFAIKCEKCPGNA